MKKENNLMLIYISAKYRKIADVYKGVCGI